MLTFRNQLPKEAYAVMFPILNVCPTPLPPVPETRNPTPNTSKPHTKHLETSHEEPGPYHSFIDLYERGIGGPSFRFAGETSLLCPITHPVATPPLISSSKSSLCIRSPTQSRPLSSPPAHIFLRRLVKSFPSIHETRRESYHTHTREANTPQRNGRHKRTPPLATLPPPLDSPPLPPPTTPGSTFVYRLHRPHIRVLLRRAYAHSQGRQCSARQQDRAAAHAPAPPHKPLCLPLTGAVHLRFPPPVPHPCRAQPPCNLSM